MKTSFGSFFHSVTFNPRPQRIAFT